MKCKYKSAEELPMVLNVREVAAVLGIGLAHAYEVVRKEDFPSITLGERIVIPRDRFLQWMESEVDKKVKK